ncbi:unnamed protein product, partial [Pylaiella littoralis]
MPKRREIVEQPISNGVLGASAANGTVPSPSLPPPLSLLDPSEASNHNKHQGAFDSDADSKLRQEQEEGMRRRSAASSPASLVGDSTEGTGKGKGKQQGATSEEASRTVRERAAADINDGSISPNGSTTTKYSSSAGRGAAAVATAAAAAAVVEAVTTAVQHVSSSGTRRRPRKIFRGSPRTDHQHLTPATPVPGLSGRGRGGARLVQPKRTTRNTGTTTGASTPTQRGCEKATLTTAAAAAAAIAEKIVPGVSPGRCKSTGMAEAAATTPGLRSEDGLLRQPASSLGVGRGHLASVDRAVTRRSSAAQEATTTPPTVAALGGSNRKGLTRTTTTSIPSPKPTTANSSTTGQSGRACQRQPCSIIYACFGFPGGKRTLCRKHRQDGMVNLDTHNTGKVSGTRGGGGGGGGSSSTRRKRESNNGGTSGGRGTSGAGGVGIASSGAAAKTVSRRRQETEGSGGAKTAVVAREPGTGNKDLTSASTAAAAVTFTANGQETPERLARSAVASRMPSSSPSGKTSGKRKSSSSSSSRCPVPSRFGWITTRKRVCCGAHKQFGMVNLDKTVSRYGSDQGKGKGRKGVVKRATGDQPRGGGVVQQESEITRKKIVKSKKASSGLAKRGGAGKLIKQPAVAAKVKRRRRSKEEGAAGRDGVGIVGGGGCNGSSHANGDTGGSGGGGAGGGAAPIKRSHAVVTVSRLRRVARRPKYQACKSPACVHHASFGFLDAPGLKREYCHSHAPPGMINLTAVRKKERTKTDDTTAAGAVVPA